MISPGDFAIADRSGIVVLPLDCVEVLYERLKRHKELAGAYLENVRKGKFSNAWVDRLLSGARCPLED